MEPRQQRAYQPRPRPTIPTVEQSAADDSVDDLIGEAPEVPSRPEMRPPMREEDSRARAARKAAELRAHGALNEDSIDKFSVPQDYIPDGWEYEWKRKTVLGAEDPAYVVSTARAGWEPVDASRHPDFMPKGWKGAIERDGMILMERPKEIGDDARARERRKAQLQVGHKEAQLNSAPDGTLPRDADPRTRARINKGWEAGIPVPE
jgi:hypothetical protein